MGGSARWLTVLVTFVLMVALVSGSAPGSGSASRRVHRAGAGVVPTGLGRFYDQDLSWGACPAFATTSDDQEIYADPGLRCAYLTVPLDYSQPAGPTIKLGLLRRPASQPTQRIGSLVINPGGPGVSGMSAAATLVDQVANNELGQRFDLVGFDPRGVGSSQPPVRCLTARERDAERQMDLGIDSSPAGVAQTQSQERADDSKCASRTGIDLLTHVGTREVARDLDVLRSALGDAKLTYLGYSYGTRIGTSYAEDFPGNVRAMILDGAVDPAQDPNSALIEQGRGFQQAFTAFGAWCTARSDCALGHDQTQAVAAYHALVLPLINHPVPVPDGRMLSYSDATIGTIQALYLPELWEPLNFGLRALAGGQGNILIQLADAYYGRQSNGTYSNEMDAFQAILCIDNPRITDPAIARDVNAQYQAVAPFLDTGQQPSPVLDNCAFWLVPSSDGPHQPHTPGLPTVLVISTTHDPATPYQAGVNLAHDLNARLLTVQGTQHTAFLHGINCVDQAGINYLTTTQPPYENINCRASK